MACPCILAQYDSHSLERCCCRRPFTLATCTMGWPPMQCCTNPHGREASGSRRTKCRVLPPTSLTAHQCGWERTVAAHRVMLNINVEVAND